MLAIILLMLACDTFPGIDAIGVQRDQVGSEIVIVKPLCSGDRVTDVSLIRAPGGNIDDSASGILWEITSEAGSTQDAYHVGVTPPGFVEKVPLDRLIGGDQSVAATIDSNFDAQALITFKPSELRSDQVLDPDGYFGPERFEARHRDRCEKN
jgi:hypothetical protein